MIDSAHLLAWVVAATSSKNSSGSSSFILLLIPLVVLGYFMLVRPQRQRARQQQAQSRQFTVGDWVMTVGGIAGRVVEANDEWIKVEVASGVQLEVLRQAVSRRLDGDPGTPGGTWDSRWSSGDSSDDGAEDDGAEDADGERPEAEGPEAAGPTAGQDETSETRAE
ncbi:MAG: preprotein translocase subunit YajC [Acidimicrobiales bacterium]|nr:preprotein translocase subunit YajC [Acidimicrobiales bacterium]